MFGSTLWKRIGEYAFSGNFYAFDEILTTSTGICMILTIILVHAEGTNSEAIILRELISRIVQFLLDHT